MEKLRFRLIAMTRKKLPAHYYPQLKKYKHLAGNYGNAWWKQKEEFESFNGPVLFTSNCIVPPRANATYKDRIYITGACGLEGAHYIPERKDGKPKDFSALIAHAKQCQPPVAIENGTLIGGFAHAQVTAIRYRWYQYCRRRYNEILGINLYK